MRYVICTSLLLFAGCASHSTQGSSTGVSIRVIDREYCVVLVDVPESPNDIIAIGQCTLRCNEDGFLVSECGAFVPQVQFAKGASGLRIDGMGRIFETRADFETVRGDLLIVRRSDFDKLRATRAADLVAVMRRHAASQPGKEMLVTK